MAQNAFDAYSIKNQNKYIDVPEGVTILNEGEVNLDMYRIIEGHVEMYIDYGTEKEVLIGILGPGACFGEFGLLLGKPAIYTIVTFSKVKLLRVTEATLGSFIQENQDCIIQIMRNMAGMMLTMSHNVDQLSNEIEFMQKRLLAQNGGSDLGNIEVTENKATIEKKDALRKYALGGKYYFMKDK